jgi:cytochrome c556
MKQLGKEAGAVRKADPKTGAELAAAGERIAGIYEAQKSFWAKRGNGFEDAAKWADEGHAIAMEFASAAKAGDAAKAGSAFQKLGGTCKQCHDAHREKLADGTYKIK